MIALKTIDFSWYQELEYLYNLSTSELVFLSVLSITASIVLHLFFHKKEYTIALETDVIEVKNYSFVTKTIVIFFILVLITMPIFKLLNTGYFL